MTKSKWSWWWKRAFQTIAYRDWIIQERSKLMNHDIRNVWQPHTIPPDKIYWKKYWEKANIDKINWEKLFALGKIYWKKYSENINIDWINWKRLFDRSAEHKHCNAIYRDSLTLIFGGQQKPHRIISYNKWWTQTEVTLWRCTLLSKDKVGKFWEPCQISKMERFAKVVNGF